MVKTIIKELIITILLCIAILIILSVIFYDYNPINKIMPNKLDAYKTPENIEEEINQTITELETTNIVYRIESSDLNLYVKTNSYVQGKTNPFDPKTNTASGDATQSGNSNGTTTNDTFWNSSKIK